MKKNFGFVKKRRITARFVCALICIATVVSACAVFMSSCGKKSSPGDSAYVKIESKGKTVSASIPVGENVDGDNVYLFGIDFWQDTSALSSLEPLAKAKVIGDEARAEADVNGRLSEMLCKGYLFAQKNGDGEYTPVTGVYYVTNPRDVHEKSGGKENVSPAPLKGAIGTPAQLIELGAASTVVTVNLSSLMSAEGGDGTIPYIWNGITYYASRAGIEALDKKIKDYTNAGIYVYLEIVQTSSKAELSDKLKDVVFDATSGRKGYALNMTSRDGASRICGMFSLLSERYGTGSEHGKADAFIIGRRVNSKNGWYAGGPGAEIGVSNYLNAVRAAYNILLSHTPSGRVYISIDNCWNVAESGNFTAKDMLSSFNNLASAGGDFFWQVAVEANPSDEADSSIWDDPMASGRSDFLSPANLETLGNQLSTDMYKCGGLQRHMLLNRFAVGGTDEEARAASYAYAYYKCLADGNVDGLVYGVVADGANDTVGAGLLTAENTVSLSEKKRIAEIFETIDSEDDPDLGFVSSLVGNKWDHLYKKYSVYAPSHYRICSAGGNAHSNDEVYVIADFSVGDMYGFSACSAAKYAELRLPSDREKPALYAPIASSVRSEKAGVVSSRISADSISEAGYLGVSLKVDSPASGATVTLVLSDADGSGRSCLLTADAAVDTNEWTKVYFDIKDFAREAEGDNLTVAVLVRPVDTGSIVSGIWLENIVSEAPVKGSFPFWIFILIPVLAAAAFGIFKFIKWFKKNYTFVRE